MLELTGNLAIGVLLAVMSVVLVLVYVLHQLRLRRRDARMKLETSQSVEDRAFNQIRIARAGADHLARQGYDVSAIEATLAQAEAKERGRQPSEALRLATSAREKLVGIRQAPVRAALAASPPAGMPGPGLIGVPMAIEPDPSPMPEGPAAVPGNGSSVRKRLAPHQAEAHFEVEELGRQLARTPGANGEASHRQESEILLTQATAAYGRAEYREAWRLALKGRRRLGEPLESVSPGTPSRPSVEPPAAPVEAPNGGSPAGCPHCGRALGANDRFCRGCGASVSTGRCPRCGAPASAEDRFCGVCGAPSER